MTWSKVWNYRLEAALGALIALLIGCRFSDWLSGPLRHIRDPLTLVFVVLIVVVVIIVIIAIIAVVVLTVLLSKKKKSGTKKRLPKSAKSAKAPAPKPAQIRKKTVTSFHAPDSKPTFITSYEPAPRTYTEPAPRTYNEPTAKSAPIIIEVNVEPSMRV